MIVLCSKCNFVEEERNGKNKLSTKGMSKTQNAVMGGVSQRRFMAGLGDKHGLLHERQTDDDLQAAETGLSAYYDKRWMLLDGIHTEPIEYHIPHPEVGIRGLARVGQR